VNSSKRWTWPIVFGRDYYNLGHAFTVRPVLRGRKIYTQLNTHPDDTVINTVMTASTG